MRRQPSSPRSLALVVTIAALLAACTPAAGATGVPTVSSAPTVPSAAPSAAPVASPGASQAGKGSY
jgi:ABC-type uncharacterized transport system auxiliary subunit